MREYQEGEFLTIHVGEEVVGTTPFSHLAFSFDGKHILAVAESNIYVMDAFDGRAIAKASAACEPHLRPVLCSWAAALRVRGCQRP